MTVDIEKAREFAVSRHGDQKYGEKPYAYHLDQVAKISMPYGETAQVIAYLHDVVEDTVTSLEEVKELFGNQIAQCVSVLTDEEGATRKERKAKTYAKMSKVGDELKLALIVKAADRLANLKASKAANNKRLLSLYSDEHKVFKESAYRGGLCDELWDEMEKLITEFNAN